MEKHYGFVTYKRSIPNYESPKERVSHYREFEKALPKEEAEIQAKRCMDCGVPFCQGDTGCPVDNLIPEFNDFIFKGLWKEALACLHSTNNFPEFTGRLCPAPCESACVLGIIDEPVSIKGLERSIIDYGFEQGWIQPLPPKEKTGKKIAIIGSGPAGLSCAQQLGRMGHSVTVYERENLLGGLLRYGIPDFKMEKFHIDRRIEQMKAEGVNFKVNTCIGEELAFNELENKNDAIVIAVGAEEPINLDIKGSELKGVHFAMDYLVQANKFVAGSLTRTELIDARDKHVIVIGGGDTGSDCIGVANRQGAKNIINFRRSEKPPLTRPEHQPWPLYPDLYYVSTSHEEGVDRRFMIRPIELIGDSKGQVKQIKICHTQKVNTSFQDVPNSEELWGADLVLIATGYKGPKKNNLLKELITKGLNLDKQGNIEAKFGNKGDVYKTNIKKVYTCGDARRGQSLIVWAISEGRKCAEKIDRDLTQ